METATTIKERLERCFADIEKERMEGIPILNQSLRVGAIGMREWQGYWLCVLLTPWFMNAMLLPGGTGPDNEEPEPVQVGTKQDFAFPAGQFEFIRGDEPAIGAYWMCSLFSPVLEFADQEAAEAAAEAALDAMLGEAEEATEKQREMAMVWQGDLPKPETGPGKTPRNDDARSSAAGSDDPEGPELSRRAFLSGTTREASA